MSVRSRSTGLAWLLELVREAVGAVAVSVPWPLRLRWRREREKSRFPWSTRAGLEQRHAMASMRCPTGAAVAFTLISMS